MGHCMIADRMSFFYNAPDKIRIVFQKVSYCKEGCRRIVLFQSVQNSWSISVFISGVKG